MSYLSIRVRSTWQASGGPRTSHRGTGIGAAQGVGDGLRRYNSGANDKDQNVIYLVARGRRRVSTNEMRASFPVIVDSI